MMHSAPISRAAGDGLEQVLRHQRVDRRHAGDVDDRDPAPGRRRCACSSALHHDLGARAVERADQRQGEDAVPELRPPASRAPASPAAGAR